MPDSKPVIDRGRKFKNTFFAFGHGHVGLTLGPITGKLIADLVNDRKPRIDLTPFAVDRF
jgi:D-amino-acid dehydrogenase